MFFVFKVEVLRDSRYLGVFQDLSQDVLMCIPRCVGVLKCLRKSSIYRSLGVVSDTW